MRDGSILSFFSKQIKNDSDNNHVIDNVIEESKVSLLTTK